MLDSFLTSVRYADYGSNRADIRRFMHWHLVHSMTHPWIDAKLYESLALNFLLEVAYLGEQDFFFEDITV